MTRIANSDHARSTIMTLLNAAFKANNYDDHNLIAEAMLDTDPLVRRRGTCIYAMMAAEARHDGAARPLTGVIANALAGKDEEIEDLLKSVPQLPDDLTQLTMKALGLGRTIDEAARALKMLPGGTKRLGRKQVGTLHPKGHEPAHA